MLLGSHVSMSGKKMLEGSAIEAHEYGETTFTDLYWCTSKHAP